MFVLRSNGTLDVWGDGEGVAVRSVKSVVPGHLEGGAPGRPGSGAHSRWAVIQALGPLAQAAAAPLSALLHGDKPTRLNWSTTGAASTLRGGSSSSTRPLSPKLSL